jgi:hypothetical protein
VFELIFKTGAAVPSPEVNNKRRRSWQEIAAELSQENDAQKVVELSHELTEAMIEDQ